MMKPPEKLYEFHVANLRAVGDALKRISLATRHAIAIQDERSTNALVRTYSLLLAAWAECRLRKVIFEPDAFTGSQRKSILNRPTELDRWNKSVELAFRKHYKIPRASLSTRTLPHSVYSRLEAINDLLSADLAQVVMLRNKLAHGQWAFPLNDSGDDIAQDQYDALRLENLLTLQYKRKLLNSIANIVNDLIVSRPAFERDFDAHFSHIVIIRQNLLNRSYDIYASSLRQKIQRGRMRRFAP